MKRSAIASVSLHALIIAAALFGLPGVAPPEIKPVEAIQVDISNITDETKLKAQSTVEEQLPEKPQPKASEAEKNTKPLENVAEEKKYAAVDPTPQEPEPQPEPEPEAEPKAEEPLLDSDPLKQIIEEEQKKADEIKKLEEEKKKKAEEKKKKEEEKKKKAADAQKKLEADMKKRKLDTNALEEMFKDTSSEQQTATLKKSEEAGTPEKGKNNVQGEDAELAATLIDALRQRLSECWTVPPGAREAQVQVKVRFNLARDGRVEGLPFVVGGGGGDALAAATAQSAISAVMECQAYDFLPKDRYDMWQEITVNFTPDMMSG
jgi:outer membrane biosynthesis protein TonB